MPVEKDVHTEHCCAVHGCKYDDDDCPVETGEKPQSHSCEACFYMMDDIILQVDVTDNDDHDVSDVYCTHCDEYLTSQEWGGTWEDLVVPSIVNHLVQCEAEKKIKNESALKLRRNDG